MGGGPARRGGLLEAAASARPRPPGATPAGAWAVFVATTPLEGAAFLAPLADAAATASPLLASLAAPHAVVVLGRTGDAGGTAASAVAFDFLPAHPRSPSTAAALLAGRAVPGVGRRRYLPAGVPRSRCVAVGPVAGAAVADPLGAAAALVAGWDGAPLSVGGNDCVSAAVSLASSLTGLGEAEVAAALAACSAAPRRRRPAE